MFSAELRLIYLIGFLLLFCHIVADVKSKLQPATYTLHVRIICIATEATTYSYKSK